jgi:hypothetical protein
MTEMAVSRTGDNLTIDFTKFIRTITKSYDFSRTDECAVNSNKNLSKLRFEDQIERLTNPMDRRIE